MRVPIRNLGRGGIVRDIPYFDMQPNQFTAGVNVLFRDGSARKVRGWIEKALVDGSVDAHWFYTWKDVDNSVYTVFALNADIKLWDGTSVTMPTHPALTTNAIDWQSDQFGKFPILNNGTDYPMYASTTDGSAWSVFPGWGTTFSGTGTVEIVRAFKSFLFALVVEGDKYTVYWSDEAAPDTFPSDWDFTSTTNLAGRNQLPASDGQLVDGLALGDAFVIYTDFAAYAARLVGDTGFVFSFDRLFGHGLLNRNCVVQVENQHFCIGNRAIYLHDGSTLKRIASDKVADAFYSEVISSERVYVTKDEINREVLVYYAVNEAGGPDTYTSKVMRWNWGDNTWSFDKIDDGDDEVTCLAPAIRSATATTYAGLSGTTYGDLIGTTYSELNGVADDIPIMHRLSVDVVSGGSTFWEMESGSTRDGTSYDAYLAREYVDLDEVSGDASDGIWHITGVFPQLKGNGSVDIRVGASMDPNTAISWAQPQTFDMDAGDYKVDVRLAGRYLSWQIGQWQGSPTTASWELSGMDIEVERRGRR